VFGWADLVKGTKMAARTSDGARGDGLDDRAQHYRELATKLRALATEARFPAAKKALVKVAKRFEGSGYFPNASGAVVSLAVV
jgi:hypothetical protein